MNESKMEGFAADIKKIEKQIDEMLSKGRRYGGSKLGSKKPEENSF